MVWLLRYCSKCDRYTLNQDWCPICAGHVNMPHPAKFSIDDRYRRYKQMSRRIAEKLIDQAHP